MSATPRRSQREADVQARFRGLSVSGRFEGRIGQRGPLTGHASGSLKIVVSCVRTADVSADGRTALFTADMPGLVPNDVRDVRQSDAFVAPLG
jgi:hypothetical protein